jgi:glycosyltransferase involved in cell wall biosynthesis
VPDSPLPVHFFTIVLNGEPFIRRHLDVFRRLPFRWHWHVVEGVAALVHDTAWSVSSGGRIDPDTHTRGLSVDGTTSYLDEIASAEPERVSVYRKSDGGFWDGKREMVSAPLREIGEECLLWEVDADELWTADQIIAVRQLFLEQPDRTAAYYWCRYFVAPNAVVATRYNFAADPRVEWLRTWRYRPGDRWLAHEPPTLVRPRRWGYTDVGGARPFIQDETEAAGAVFRHMAYGTEEQVRFKGTYYGYPDAVDRWRRLGDAVEAANGPVRLADYFPWVDDDTLVDASSRPRRNDVVVVDGVFFQYGLNSGIARVWRSYLREWLKTGFAERIVFLDRGGAGPRLEGLPTRSVPPWHAEYAAEDSLRLQAICDEEGAALFVSTYYTLPVETPSLMLVYDLIPERLGLDLSDPVWEEKRLAIEHATSYACISENTRRDLFELEPTARDKPAVVVPLGVDDRLRPADADEIATFRTRHRIERPYFLLVGERVGLGGYKNAELLFRALAGWPDARDHDVVCVGGAARLEPELRRLSRGVRVRRLALDDDELRLAYAGAAALVFPSRYEGFGLPIAEAMACGCPVITTAAASIPEVAGDAAAYVDPADPESLRDALAAVGDPVRRDAMIAAGLARAEQLTWSRAAAVFASVIDSAAAPEAAAEREARASDWTPRRLAQARAQSLDLGRRRLLMLQRPSPARIERLKDPVRRYAPAWLLTLLRSARASLRVQT